jgi:DNA primase
VIDVFHPRYNKAEASPSVGKPSDIATIIGSYFTSQEADGELRAPCPFHCDTGMSFHVDPAQQTFTCRECDVSGGRVDFIARYENISRREAEDRLT